MPPPILLDGLCELLLGVDELLLGVDELLLGVDELLLGTDELLGGSLVAGFEDEELPTGGLTPPDDGLLDEVVVPDVVVLEGEFLSVGAGLELELLSPFPF